MTLDTLTTEDNKTALKSKEDTTLTLNRSESALTKASCVALTIPKTSPDNIPKTGKS